MKKLFYFLFGILIISCSNDVTPEANSALNVEIEGMVCEMGCVSKIKESLQKTKGVVSTEIDFKTQTGKITFDHNQTSTADLIKVIETLNDSAYKVNSSKAVCLKDCDKTENSTPVNEGKIETSSTQPDVSLNGFQLPNIFNILNALLH